MPDGCTLRDHLLAAARRGAEVPELDPLPVPVGCQELLTTFWQLRRQAGGNGLAANPVTYQAIESWAALYGVQLSPWEVDTIMELDAVALQTTRDKGNGGDAGR